ncbi:hypothetical protein [Lactococcus petauri]|uniref:hypothetical protein n=1 Tax=Lactococcus petauri TaxID=1940789 RepID=UPI00254C3736|nr:hypothetical protein [Lactococcus petauri]
MKKIIGALFILCLIVAMLEKVAPFLLIGGALYGAYRYQQAKMYRQYEAELREHEIEVASAQREIVESAYKILDDGNATASQKQQAKNILKDPTYKSAREVVDMIAMRPNRTEPEQWDNF